MKAAGKAHHRSKNSFAVAWDIGLDVQFNKNLLILKCRNTGSISFLETNELAVSLRGAIPSFDQTHFLSLL